MNSISLSEPSSHEADIQAAKHYHRNFNAGLIHGIFFQASAAFANINTVLPAFVSLLTSSTFAIGLLAGVQGIGGVLPQMFTAYLLEDKVHKKPYLLAIITLRWISWAFLAWLTFTYGSAHPTLILIVLIILFSLFSIAGGVGTVVYADIFSKAIPAQRRGRFTGLRQMLGFTMAIGAGYVVKRILDNDSGIPFPNNYALIFMLSALFLLIAFLGFALIKEPAYPTTRTAQSLSDMLRQALLLARQNSNFRRVLWTKALMMAGLALAPFYVVYARTEIGVEAGMIGLFLMAQMVGGASSNILWGWLGDRVGNKQVILWTAVSGTLIPLLALLATTMSPYIFLAVFAALGATMSGMNLGFNNFMLEMAPLELRPTCIALQNSLLAPLALLPILVGLLIQTISFPILFVAIILLMMINIVLSTGIIEPRSCPEIRCVRI